MSDTEKNVNEEPIEEEKSEILPENPGKKSTIFGVIFLLVITAAVLVVLLNLNDFNSTMRLLGSIKQEDILPAILCLTAFVIISPFSLCLLCRVKRSSTSFMQNYLIGASEHFFNGITPYQTGAQPFQVYYFARRGVSAAEGTGLIITNYIAHLFALNGLIAISLIYSGDFFGSFVQSGTVWIPVLGIVMSFLTLFIFFGLATSTCMRAGIKRFVRWLCRFKWIGKKLSGSIPTFDAYCDNAQMGAREVLAHPLAFIGAIAIRLASLLFYYAIPFFILRALDVELSYEFFFYTLMATCFATNAVVWIPTPGTAGGIEFSFTVLFSLFAGFSGAVAAAAAILWRALTYYILMIVSFAEYLVLEIFFKNKRTKDNS